MTGNFWARKLGQLQPQPPVRSAPNTEHLRPWWSSAPPPQENTMTLQEFREKSDSANGDVIDLNRINPRRYAATTQDGDCPQCQSGNYFAAVGTKLKRCFDCGYPVVQSTSGMSNTQQSGVQGGAPSSPARQITRMTVTDGSGRILGSTENAAGGMVSNYHPDMPAAGRITDRKSVV